MTAVAKGAGTLSKHFPFIRIKLSLFLSFIHFNATPPPPPDQYIGIVVYISTNNNASCRNVLTMAKQEERIEMASLLKRLNHVDISFSGNSQDSTQHRLCSKFLSFSV